VTGLGKPWAATEKSRYSSLAHQLIFNALGL
jgi:hypothetical protein